MKRTNFVLSLLLGLFVTAFALTACSSDDEEGKNENPLVGTWTLKSANEKDLKFTQITLKSDGTGEYPGMEAGYYIKWTANENTLRIDLGQGHPDDSLIGTYAINGNTLTYSYHWIDYDGKWESDNIYTTTWEKQ